MTILLSVLSSILYRIGGMDKKIIPFANSQFRDIGCPILVLIILLQHGILWYLAALASLLVLGFIRTYHDYTGQDNMYLHGLFIGFSMLPLYWSGVQWYQIVLYSASLAIVMGALNTFCTRVSVQFSDWIEELTRGFIIIYFLKIFIL